ncbi:MAG: flagellin [Terriglobia bacterium]
MGGLGVLFNIPAIQSQNQLQQTNTSLQTALTQLTTGSRINSGADDPAGLQISNLLNAQIAALNQSVNNASDSVGFAQVADGALSQVSTLLNTSVTLATEASNGGLSSQQLSALGTEYGSILNEINNIGANTNYNGQGVFTSATVNAFLTDLTTSYTISITTTTLTTGSTGLNLTTTNFSTSGNPQAALGQINSAIILVGQLRGSIGAAINQLNDGANVDTVEAQNTTSALNTINSANIPQVVSNLNKYSILEQTGIYSLTQANALPQGLLKLLQ